MNFRSDLSTVSKRDRAVVLLLAIADLLARGGERVGVPGLIAPTPHRRAAERAANAIALLEDTRAFPDTHAIRRYQDLIIVGDFLDDIDATSRTLTAIAASGARGHLVQVLDPVEETFPFSGRTEFRDPETGERIIAGRAESWANAYHMRFAAHRDALRQLTARLGWSLLIHHTDRPAAEPLLALHGRLSAAARGAGDLRASGSLSTPEAHA
jgi:uncharacterized protein (DUF58 family)